MPPARYAIEFGKSGCDRKPVTKVHKNNPLFLTDSPIDQTVIYSITALKRDSITMKLLKSIGYILGYPLTSEAVKVLVEGNEEIPGSGDAGLTRAVDMSKNNLYIEAAGIIDNIFYKAQYHKLFSDFLYHAKNQGYDTIVMHARAETLNNVLKNKEIDIESPDKETKEKYGVAIFENWWGLGQRFTRVIIGINDACDLFPSV